MSEITKSEGMHMFNIWRNFRVFQSVSTSFHSHINIWEFPIPPLTFDIIIILNRNEIRVWYILGEIALENYLKILDVINRIEFPATLYFLNYKMSF